MPDRLTPDELRLWHAWKNAGELVRARVVRDVNEATGLSDPDFGVLDRLETLGDGHLAQQELADSMGWSKSRLSRHLTRMQERELVARQPRRGAAGVLITIAPAGRQALERARPVHAAAVRRHLLDRLDAREASTILALADRLRRDEG